MFDFREMMAEAERLMSRCELRIKQHRIYAEQAPEADKERLFEVVRSPEQAYRKLLTVRDELKNDFGKQRDQGEAA